MPEFFDSSEDLLASGGWLAAHKKSQTLFERNPVSERSKSLSGEISNRRSANSQKKDWQHWSYPLFTDKYNR